jgi:hypothetical protein
MGEVKTPFYGAIKRDKEGRIIAFWFPDVGWVNATIAPVKVWSVA